MSTADLRSHLQALREERAVAIASGVADIGLYMADLESEIAACRDALIGSAVTEIASFRARLAGPQVG